MDETFLLIAARHIECNPVRAALVENPWDYQWSSASAYFTEKNDDLVNVSPLTCEIADDWRYFLSEVISKQEREVLRQYERNGRKETGTDASIAKTSTLKERGLNCVLWSDNFAAHSLSSPRFMRPIKQPEPTIPWPSKLARGSAAGPLDLGFINNQISFLSFVLHAFGRILIGALFFLL
ncbi:MAG: hypothetical protein SVY10_01585 [Thermodesulfobacteriota bacterium]|nr:hypothetical protein [Thermodesulfobacteriota bacterium]